MATTHCSRCGTRVSATDESELVGQMMQHFADQHPGERPLTDD